MSRKMRCYDYRQETPLLNFLKFKEKHHGKKQIIDVHCHLFNAKYAVMELASASWNHLRGNYPHQKGATFLKMQRLGIIETLEGIKDFAAYIARLLKATLSDCEGNYKTALENFANSNLSKNATLIVTPLMMDIYFALDDNTDEAELERKGRFARPGIEAFAITEDKKKDFEEHFKKSNPWSGKNLRRYSRLQNDWLFPKINSPSSLMTQRRNCLPHPGNFSKASILMRKSNFLRDTKNICSNSKNSQRNIPEKYFLFGNRPAQNGHHETD